MDLVISMLWAEVGFCMKRLDLPFLELAEKNPTTHIVRMTGFLALTINWRVSEIYIFV